MAAEVLEPSRVEIDRAADLLSRVSGREITAEMIVKDGELGAPMNDDGTVNLFAYAAWLVRELRNAGN